MLVSSIKSVVDFMITDMRYDFHVSSWIIDNKKYDS